MRVRFSWRARAMSMGLKGSLWKLSRDAKAAVISLWW